MPGGLMASLHDYLAHLPGAGWLCLLLFVWCREPVCWQRLVVMGRGVLPKLGSVREPLAPCCLPPLLLWC